MTVLPFLHSGDAGDLLLGKFSLATGLSDTTATPRFAGTSSVALSGESTNNSILTGVLAKDLPAAERNRRMRVSWAMRWPSSFGANTDVRFWVCGLSADSIVTPHCCITMNSTGFLSVRRGNTTGTILFTSSQAIAAATWYHLELIHDLHDTTGEVELWINGILIGSFSGDTKNGGTETTIGRVAFATGVASVTTLLRDLSIDAGAGLEALGDTRVEYLATDGNGGVQQWDLSTGADAEALVDENPPNTTDYVFTDVDNEIERFTLANLADNTKVVHSFQMGMYHSKDDAGARQLRVNILSGATAGTGADHAPSVGSFVIATEAYRLDPATSAAWLGTAVDAVQVGVEARP